MGRQLTEGPVTVLFTDVEGSTALRSRLGDAEAEVILGAYDRVIRREIQVHRGRAIKSLGDGVMAAFSSPRNAVDCALTIQDVIGELARDQDVRHRIRVRIGVHTGEVAVASGDILGSAVNAAARICARACGEEILVSEVVRQLCGAASDAVFTDRGRLVLKGFPERWHLYRVSAGHAAAVLAGHEGRTPFVGRCAERTELRVRMRRALAGHGGLVMIGGEPGVGKTRLSMAVAAEARQLGFHAAVGHCYEAQGDQPYMPWVELVEAAAQEMSRAAFRQALGEAAPEIARLVPRLRRMFDDIPPPLELPADQQRRYTFTGLREFLIRVARGKPQLLVLEDLQWADEGTVLFLEQLAEGLPGISALVIGTFRDPPCDMSPTLEQVLRGLARRQGRLLTLGPHSDAEVAVMLHWLAGRPPPPALTAAIYAETEGNAFFVEEVFRHLVDTGALLDDQGQFRADLRTEKLDVPENVRLLIGQRLARLSADAGRMLGVAAVVGRHFSFELLEEVAELEADLLLDAIDQAERARLIRPDEQEQAEYTFSHELIRQAILARLSAPRRQRLHLRVASALERRHGDAVEVHAADIARHLLLGGAGVDPARTATYLVLAGDRAVSATAYEEALRHYTNALQVLRPSDVRLRADLLLKIGLAQRSLSRWDDTVETWREALPVLEMLGDVESLARLCYELSYQLGWAYRNPESIAVAERGLAAVGEAAGPHRTRLQAVAAAGLTMANRYEEALVHLEEAGRRAREDGDASLIGEVEFVELFYQYSTMQLRDALLVGRHAQRTLREAGSLWHLASVDAFLDVAAVFQGRFDESEMIERELYPLAQRLGHAGAAAVTRRSEFPKAAAQQADLTALATFSRAHMEMASSMGPGWLAHANTLQGIVDFWAGDWESARRHMEQAVGMTVSPSWFGTHHGFLIMLLAFSRQREEAWAHLYDVMDRLPSPGSATSIGPWTLAILAAEAAGVVGDRDVARFLHPIVVEALATGTVMRQYDGRLIQTVAGMAAAAAELPDAAEDHFQTALRQADELPHLMEQPHVRHHYGAFLLGRCGSEDARAARTLLEDAAARYRALGMRRHEAMVKALLTGIELKGRIGMHENPSVPVMERSARTVTSPLA